MFRAFLMGVTLTIGLVLSVVNYRNDDMQGFAGVAIAVHWSLM